MIDRFDPDILLILPQFYNSLKSASIFDSEALWLWFFEQKQQINLNLKQTR